MLLAFPGKAGGDRGIRMNIARIYDQKFSVILEKMYGKIDVEITIDPDEPTDVNGYLGKTQFYREQVGKLQPCSEKEILKAMYKDN